MAGKQEDFLARNHRNAESARRAGTLTEELRVTPTLEKSLTGIRGFDEITKGGVPKGRPTIVCGGPGCGKTMFALKFLVRGAMQYKEPGGLVTLEETAEEMTKSGASLGFDLKDLEGRKKLFMDYVRVEPTEIQETGEYDLEGLFVRLQQEVDSVGAKRVVLDTLEAVFSGFSNSGLLRAEIRRLFRWLKDRGLTTVVTAGKGDGTLPGVAMKLNHAVSDERVSSGIPDLDAMLEGKGFYRGSSILVSGTSGSGKSSTAAHFAEQTCREGKRCLYVAFEESQAQAVRNMGSIGINLEAPIKKGLLRFEAWRPTQNGLEMHLLRIHKLVEQHQPDAVIIDPITNLTVGTVNEMHSALMRLIDFLKSRGITALLVSLTAGKDKDLEQTEVGISSLIDTWIFLRDVELNGERNGCLYVLKSRGMAHSNQVREFVMTKEGVRLLPVYVGAGTVLTGSARLSQEARERAEEQSRQEQTEQKRKELERRRASVEGQIELLRAQLVEDEERFTQLIREEEGRKQRLEADSEAMSKIRRVESAGNGRAMAEGA